MPKMRTKVVVGMTLVGGLCLLLAAFAFFSPLGLWVPNAATAAAQRDYVRQTGARNITVSRSVGWRTCAIVELAGVPTTGVVSVVVTREGNEWKTVRVAKEKPGQWFDPDDVSSSDACVSLARGK